MPLAVSMRRSSVQLSLRLTFDAVGVTPWNAYDVRVDPETHVVTGWSFRRSAGDAEAMLVTPWVLERRGPLLLPVSHGRDAPWSIEVFADVPRSLFEEAEPKLDMDRLRTLATPLLPTEPGR